MRHTSIRNMKVDDGTVHIGCGGGRWLGCSGCEWWTGGDYASLPAVGIHILPEVGAEAAQELVEVLIIGVAAGRAWSGTIG